MKGYRKYFGKKIIWFLITFVVAVFLNFFLPRLMPADPVAAITGKMANGMSDASAVQEIYERYAEQFGTNKPMAEQFLIFCKNAIHGDFGLSFSQYPRSVSNIISSAIMWTICLQLPAILVGWLLGNLLGALAAYIRKGFDKVLLPTFLFLGNVPAFGMAVILLVLFAVKLKWAPISGGYGFDMIPNFGHKETGKYNRAAYICSLLPRECKRRNRQEHRSPAVNLSPSVSGTAKSPLPVQTADKL